MRVLSPSDLRAEHGGQSVLVGGRVLAVADQACQLADAFTKLTVAFAERVALDPGDLLVVTGEYRDGSLVRSTLAERSVHPTPRGDGDIGRFMLEGVGRRLSARADARAAARAYFAAEQFLEVETPLRVPAPGVDLHLEAIRADGGHLITSPELHMKRLLVAGLPRIFQFARASRAEELGHLHEPEFTMLEWYRAFAGLPEILADTEQLVATVARSVAGRATLTLPDGRALDATPPFARVTVREAFAEHAGIHDAVDLALGDEARYFEILVSRVEPGLARESRPLFLWQYPSNQASLARLNESDPSVAERFELYAGGVELCNGFAELTDPIEQRRRFEHERALREQRGRPSYPLDERFLAALQAGMPRAVGNALGFDRLLMLALGCSSIADVIAFPAQRL
ncbi:MAG TPA: EF-P lysine aminoacylase EpmA [Polyangiaceae bacterium]|jgi:lysyl-tRNA synthetase class 2